MLQKNLFICFFHVKKGNAQNPLKEKIKFKKMFSFIII